MSRPLTPADLADPALFSRGIPHRVFDEVRSAPGLQWNAVGGDVDDGFWVVARHADVVTVSRDTETYSSAVGHIQLYDIDEDALDARASMIDMDPPIHTRLRRLVSAAFTPRHVQSYTPTVRERVRDRLSIKRLAVDVLKQLFRDDVTVVNDIHQDSLLVLVVERRATVSVIGVPRDGAKPNGSIGRRRERRVRRAILHSRNIPAMSTVPSFDASDAISDRPTRWSGSSTAPWPAAFAVFPAPGVLFIKMKLWQKMPRLTRRTRQLKSRRISDATGSLTC